MEIRIPLEMNSFIGETSHMKERKLPFFVFSLEAYEQYNTFYSDGEIIFGYWGARKEAHYWESSKKSVHAQIGADLSTCPAVSNWGSSQTTQWSCHSDSHEVLAAVPEAAAALIFIVWTCELLRTVVYKLEHLADSPGGLVKAQRARLYP